MISVPYIRKLSDWISPIQGPCKYKKKQPYLLLFSLRYLSSFSASSFSNQTD